MQTHCPHCGETVLEQSAGDIEAGLWAYKCGTIGGAWERRGTDCIDRVLKRYEKALHFIAWEERCYSLEVATQTAREALS